MIKKKYSLEHLLASRQNTREKEYWSKIFSGDLVKTGFPYDENIEEVLTGNNMKREKFELPKTLFEKLIKLSAGKDPALLVILKSGIIVLLNIYTGNKDIIAASPIYKQDFEGEFTNTLLVLRQYIENSMTFKEIILGMKDTLEESVKNQNYPVEILLDELNYLSSENKVSFLDAAILLENIQDKRYIQHIDFNIIFSFKRTEEYIKGEVEYNSIFYKEKTIKKIVTHYIYLLSELLSRIDTPLSLLNIVPEKEKEQILYVFNDTKSVYPEERVIYELFEERVKQSPDSVSVVYEDKKITHGKLNAQANRLSRILKEKGIESNSIVSIILERSIEMLIGIIGVLKAGGTFLPIDPDFPDDRIKYMLKDSKSKVVVSRSNLADRVNFANETIVIDKIKKHETDRNDIKKMNDPTDILYIIYTSGTSGTPKGVLINNKNMMNYITWFTKKFHVTSSDKTLFTASFAFDAVYTQIFVSISTGSRLYMIDRETNLSDEKLLNCFEKNKITYLKVTPSLFRIIVSSPYFSKKVCQSLRFVIIGGEEIIVTDVEKAHDICNHMRIINHYGPTETTIGSCAQFIDFDRFEEYKKNTTIGKPINNTQVYILDNDLRLLPTGIYGELVIGGDGLGRGYLNNPELTAEKFVSFASGGQLFEKSWTKTSIKPLRGSTHHSGLLYKTGDLARLLPDGKIELSGRIDSQVKIRGYRVELGEIENRLLKNEEIEEALVLVRKDRKGGKYLCAYMVARREIPLSELRDYLLKELPDYMVPVYFVQMDALPLTQHNKVDRKRLPEPEVRAEQAYAAPGNEVEKKLVEIWKEVLDRENIGITDSFFMLGGDSIKSIQVVARMYQAGYKIEVKDIFLNHTIVELAPFVKKVDRIADQSTVAGTLPLTPIQKAFFEREKVDVHHFNHAVMLYLEKGFDGEAVKAVFNKIQEHHDALRMTFAEKNGEIVQIQQGLEHPLSLEIYDFRNREKVAEAVEIKSNEIQAAMDLEKGPLMKLGLFHLDDGDRLLIVIHHLVIDGISWRILFEDIEALFQQYKNGEELTLPLKTDSFKRWSEKLAEYADSERFLKEAAYWRELESVPVSALKRDFEEESNFVNDTTTLSFRLSKEETGFLLVESNEAFGTEIEDLLLTALGLGIKKTSGHNRLLLALEGHGREAILNDVDISRTLGWFTSVYPVIFDMSYANDLSRQIKEVKETLHRVPDKGIGYGILRYLTLEENKSGHEFNLKARIRFNYWGQLDADMDKKSFRIARESPGPTRAVRGQRECDLDISGMIVDEKLTMSIAYNTKQYKSETVESLLDHYKKELSYIISYCLEKKEKELTPSDLTYKELSIDDLDQLSKQYQIEDIYPLSPMQEGMFLHHLYDMSSSAYFEQMSYRLHGDLDILYIEKSVNVLLERYEILRTAFIHGKFDRSLQIVLKERKVDFYYKDISNLGDKEKKALFIRQFREQDKRRSFDLSKDVLIRVSILREDDDGYEFIWSIHHILIDGWCRGILVSNFFEIYNSYLENRPYHLPRIKQYREYLEWLERQDKEVSRNYWKKYLENYEEAAIVPVMKAYPDNNAGYKCEKIGFQLEKEKTMALHHLAVSNHFTLNTVIQAVWGIILGKYNNKQDVIFGIVVSGRPPEVEGVELMVGPFINSIPFRVRFNEDTTFKQLLHKVQRDALDMNPHQYLSLAEIQSFSTLKRDLINHALVFENYPLFEPEIIEDNKGIKLEVSGWEIFGQGNYDLFLVVFPGEELSVDFMYNGNVYNGAYIEKVVLHIKEVVNKIIENSNIKIKDLKISQSLLYAKSNIMEYETGEFRL